MISPLYQVIKKPLVDYMQGSILSFERRKKLTGIPNSNKITFSECLLGERCFKNAFECYHLNLNCHYGLFDKYVRNNLYLLQDISSFLDNFYSLPKKALLEALDKCKEEIQEHLKNEAEACNHMIAYMNPREDHLASSFSYQNILYTTMHAVMFLCALIVLHTLYKKMIQPAASRWLTRRA